MAKAPKLKMEENERGTQLDLGYYSVDGRLVDVSQPSSYDLSIMRDSDTQIQSLEGALVQPLQAAKGRIKAAPGGEKEATLCREVLEQSQYMGGMTTPIGQVFAQMTQAVTTKRSYFELVWKARESDGMQVYHKVAWRPPEQCDILLDKNGSYNGFEQEGLNVDGTPLTEKFYPGKSFVYIHRNDRRPMQGESAFRTAYGDYVDKKKIKRLLFIHLQNFALGTIHGKYSGQEGRTGMRKLFNKLKKWQGGGGVLVTGDKEEVEYKALNGSAAEFLEVIRYLDSQMAGSLLLNFLQYGPQSGNSDGLGGGGAAKTNFDFFLQALEAVLRDMAESVTNHLLAPLVRANFGPKAKFPTYEFETLSGEAEELALGLWEKLTTEPPVGPLWDAIEDKVFTGRLGIEKETVDKHRKERPRVLPAAAIKDERAMVMALIDDEDSTNGNGHEGH